MAQNYSCDQVKLDGIKHEILPMMTKTLEHLRKECFFFKNSSIDLVGSAPENSKVGEPDEFDFAIKMPDLAKAENGYGWVAGAATGWMMEHPSYAGMTDDDVEGQFEENIFHVMIKEYFYHTMKNYLPQTYEIIESQCHHKVQIAGTFHIMRKSDGFVVDIDICFWVTYHRQFLKETFSSDFPQRDKYWLTPVMKRHSCLLFYQTTSPWLSPPTGSQLLMKKRQCCKPTNRTILT